MSGEPLDLLNISDEEDEIVGYQRPAQREPPRFRTMRDLRKEEEGGDEGRQTFYAGGSEHSGQQVMGPRDPGRPPEFVSSLFEAARNRAVEMNRGPTRGPFSGTGYRLGQTDSDTEVLSGPSTQASQAESRLTLYRNGFVLNNIFRDYQDPKNIEFIETVKNGEVPDELLGFYNRGTGTVKLCVVDKSDEEYSMSSADRRAAAFSGQGHMLGSPTPRMAPTTSPDSPVESSHNEIVVNDQEKIVTVIVKHPDGSKQQIKVNLTHTLNDIIEHLKKTRPELTKANFGLMTSFPPKSLENLQLTVSEAGIANSLILIKLI